MSYNFQDLYDEVFKEINPEIEFLGRGVLYKSIQIILLEDELNTEQKQTPTICKQLSIEPSASKDEDINHVLNLRGIFAYTLSGHNGERGLQKIFETTKSKAVSATKDLFNDKSGDKKMEELKWIVIVACTVVGLTVCIQYLEKQNKKNNVSKKKPVNPKPEDLQYKAPRRPIPAALCLIVPANIATRLSNPINIEGLSNLIDNASYFICTNESDADSKQRQLTMTDENISPDSNREFYVRIKISDGNDLIGKKIRYAIKTNLPLNASFVVEKIACLRSLTGLESFNRV
jgi:hypothetical protein